MSNRPFTAKDWKLVVQVKWIPKKGIELEPTCKNCTVF